MRNTAFDRKLTEHFVSSYRYVPNQELYDYNIHFPLVNSCRNGQTQQYFDAMSYAPFFYNIPYFYLDGE